MSIFVVENGRHSEVVYSPEMDKEAKQFLQELANILRERPGIADAQASPGRGSEGLADLGPAVREIGNDVKWHRTVGWGIAGVYAVVFGGLLTWYLPKELGQQATQAKADFSLELGKQLGPIVSQVASLTGALEVLKPNAANNVPKLLRQNLQQRNNPELAMETIAAIAEKAKEVRLAVPDVTIREIGKELAES